MLEDTGETAVSGVVTLYNGSKYNALGTFRANTSPGSTRAVFLCTGGSPALANDQVETLIGLLGKSGTLVAIEYTATTVATHTASAVVTVARPIATIDQFVNAVGKPSYASVELVFDRLSEWS